MDFADVVGHRRVVAQLADGALERAVGVGVDGKRDILPGVDVADVGLVHRRPDFHPFQFLGDEEKAGDKLHERLGEELVDLIRVVVNPGNKVSGLVL